MIIGCCGAGKSTFAKKLGNILPLEVIHLDQHYWQPNWTETAKEEWEEIVSKLAQKESWIIDGNYGGTMDLRIDRADTIIYLDYPTWKCLWRITKRIIKHRGHERPDMATGCQERFDLEFYHYVATFNLMRRKALINKMQKLKSQKTVHIFRNDKETGIFLNALMSNTN